MPTACSESDVVRKGQILGYVGVSGNAPKDTPHLHFAIFRLTDQKRWWEGAPVDPYDVLALDLPTFRPDAAVQACAREELCAREPH